MIKMNETKLIGCKRRAFSSIIGIFFFIVIFAGAFTAFALMLNTTSDFLGTQAEISKKEIDKLQEEFDVSAISFPYRDDQGQVLFNHNKYNLTVEVENKGPNHIEIVDLFIINKTNPDGTLCQDASSSPCEANFIEINYADSFIPVRSINNILENTLVTMERGDYDLKFVTALGTKKTISIKVGGPILHLKMLAIPPQVHNLSNMTLLLTVTNNSSKTLYDVKPNDLFPTLEPPTAISAEEGETKTILNDLKVIPILKPFQSTSFTFEYELKGAQGGEVTFTTNATAKKSKDSTDWTIFSNNATVTIRMTGDSGEALAGAEIRQKPKIFLVFPLPAGAAEDDESRGFWGAIIVNPTNQTVDIDRVTLQMTTPAQGGSQSKIISKFEEQFDHIEPCCWARDNEENGGNSKPTENYDQSPDGKPDAQGRWTIPDQNLLVWTNDNTTNTVSIFPYTAQEFVIRTQVEVASDLASFLVVANAHTSMGQFSTVGHTSAVRQDQKFATVVNVYPTSLDVSGNSSYTDDDDYNINAVNTIDTLSIDNVFNVTIREGSKYSSDDDTYIPGWGTVNADRGAKLIMKLPPGFPKLNVKCCNPDNSPFDQTGFLIDSTSPRFVEFLDGSIQMEVKIGSHLGDGAGSGFDVERFTFQYSLDAPKIKKDQIYIYYIFANGRDVHDNPIGPVSESVVLRIVGLESECFGKQGQTVLQEPFGTARVCE